MSWPSPCSWDGEELTQRIRASGLRGRGGGWFPTAKKWQAVKREGGRPIAIANGGEGEPGSIKDRFIMMSRPQDVLEGLALAARAVGADEAIVYLKGSFAGPEKALTELASRASWDGVAVSIRRGCDTYVAGEETALLEALEGKRAWPRPKPPLPYAVGFQGRPTLVQNVETLSLVPSAATDPEGFRRGESTLVSLWGHVRRPGVYRVRLGTPLIRLIETEGGGAPDGLQMIFPAGPSGAPLLPDQAETPLHPDALRDVGSALGSASVLVIGRSACPLAVAASLAGFFEKEACGQCPPCVVGTANVSGILRRVESGGARPQDLRYLEEAAGFMAGHGYCAHSRTAAASVTGLLARFPHDTKAHLDGRGCPRPEGRVDPFHPDSPERVAIESSLETVR